MKSRTVWIRISCWLALFASALAPALAPAEERAGKACFADAAIDPVASRLLPLLPKTDELVTIEMQDGASAQSVYLLTRQMVLTERILRRLLGRGTDCATIGNGIASEYAMLKRGFGAFAQGDPQLGIEPVASRRSQALLQDILATLSEADAAILTLLR